MAVIKFPVQKSDTELVKDALEMAEKADLDSILVIGWGKNDSLYTFWSKQTEAEALWLMEVFRLCLISGDFSDIE